MASFDPGSFYAGAFDTGSTVIVSPIPSIDHVGAAVSRLCEQFKDKPNIVALLSLFAARYNTLESVCQAMLTLRNVYTATGAPENLIGKIVGQARLGLSNDDYRRYILARIATNRSDAVIEDLISVAVLVLNNSNAQVVIDNQGWAAVVVRILNIAVSDSLANILLDFEQHAVAGGVRCIVETQYDSDANTWFFAQSTFSTGTVNSGSTSIPVTSTAGFPPTGTLDLEIGTSNADTVTYGGITATSFINLTPGQIAHTHASNTEVSLNGAPGLGMGDTSNGNVGGELVSARVAHYP